MKRMFSVLLVLALFSAFACARKKQLKKLSAAGFVWMQYDETRCNNPWQFNWLMEPTDEQQAAAVKSHLEGGGIRILEIKTSRDTDMVSCEACDCPNGLHYFVRVNQAEKAKLKELQFKEAALDKIPR